MSNSGHPGYDEKLLAAAPAVDKGMLQSGYTTDLLEKPGSSPTPPPDLEAGRKPAPRGSQRNYSNPPPASKPPPPQEKTPFFRTTKGIIVIVVAFIVILAAVVGGAVGGTKKKNNKVETQSAGSGNSTGTGVTSAVSQTTVGPAGPIGSTTSTSTIVTVDPIGGAPSKSPLPTSIPPTISGVPDTGGNPGGGNPPIPIPSNPTQTSPDGSETQGVGVGVSG